MPDLLLHHYPSSPFSEKVRLVLGCKRMSWRSVIVPTLMPKPDVVALTGGYRRTPFAQIGADVYADSALICRLLDRIEPTPPLYPDALAGLAETVAQWADSNLFWTAVPYTMQPAGAAHLMKGATPEMLKAFGADRAAMNPGFRRPTLADGHTILRTYLGRLESMLAGGPFLLGAAPTIADFAAVQSVWFMRRAPPIAEVLDAFPAVSAWHERVAGYGHGRSTETTSAEAIEIASRGEFAPSTFFGETGLSEQGDVSVTPTDYAHDPVAGRLVGLSPDEVVVERTDPRAGTVRVHFPRVGFQIKPAVPT